MTDKCPDSAYTDQEQYEERQVEHPCPGCGQAMKTVIDSELDAMWFVCEHCEYAEE